MTRQEILSIRALRKRAERHAAGLFVVEGEKGIIELAKSTLSVQRIYCVATMIDVIPDKLQAEMEQISAKEMDRITQMTTAPGILAVVAIPHYSVQHVLEQIESAPTPIGLVASRVADPGNLGTLIRSVDWFGMGGILVSADATDPWSSKCVQASMGSIFRVPVAVLDVEICSEQAHFHLEMEGTPYTEVAWKKGLLWVGSESHGFKGTSLPEHSIPVHIPAKGRAESLNAGVAGSVVCAEIARAWKEK